MRARKVIVSEAVVGNLTDSDSSLNQVFRGCIFAELYVAGINISMSQRILETTCSELAKFSEEIDRVSKRKQILSYLKDASMVKFLLKHSSYLKHRRREECQDVRAVERLILRAKGPKEIEHRERKIEILNGIKSHPEEGLVELNKWLTWAARLYVLITLGLTILVAARNVGNSKNWLRRVLDGLQVLTFLWFSVFGQIKLTSEDASIVKHIIEGVIILRNSDHVIKHLHCQDATELKQLVMETERNLVLAPTECSYTREPWKGTIQLLGV